MKKIVMIMVLGALMAFLVPVSAQSNGEQWKSTSVMQTSGSNYTPQVTEVGAPMAASEATTTTEGSAPAKAPGGPRKGFGTMGDTGQDSESPLGDAVLPLMLMAMAFSGVVYMRKRKAA